MEIGSKGLSEVDLITPQSTSLMFDIVHTTNTGEAGVNYIRSDI